MDQITFEALLTITGAGTFALVVRQLVEVLKAVFPLLNAQVAGSLQAFVVTLVAYVVAVIVTPAIQTPDGVLQAIIAWVMCAVAAVGIDQVLGPRIDRAVKRVHPS
jgi:hypothetical protein